MKRTRIQTLLLGAALFASLYIAVPGLAAATDLDISINGKSTTDAIPETDLAKLSEVGGSVSIPIWVSNTGSVTETLLQIVPDTSRSSVLQGATFTSADGTNSIASGDTKMFIVTCPTLGAAAAQTYPKMMLQVYTNTNPMPQTVYFNLQKTSPSTTATPPPTTSIEPEDENIKALALDAKGADGQVVPAPAGDAGDQVMLRLPIKCRQGVVSGAQITPVLSSNLDEFPFVIQAVDYTRQLPTMGIGNVAELQYDMTLSPDVTSGVKGVTFNAVYYKDGVLETSSFKVYVNVLKGKAESAKDADGNLITSMPKLIVESYSVTPKEPQPGDPKDRLFAGEPFVLKFTVRNTSDKESVQNIQMMVSNNSNAIMPANGSSNALYIKSIGKGGSEACSIELQSVPDAEAKPQNLNIAFDYEGANLQKQYSTKQDLTLAVSQRMRVKIDEPTVYADGLTPGGTAGISFGVYNQGKGTIYNCMVEVEGPGLQMEESLSGGNISAGSSMRADFNIIASEEGEIAGKIIILYEDVYEEQTRVEKPITLYVMEDQPVMEFGEDPMMDPGMMGQDQPKGGFPWFWVGLGGAAAAGAAVLLIMRKKKCRSRELEEA